MMAPDTEHKSVRAGLFSSLAAADHAVAALLADGFSKEEITVVCSDSTKERFFREFEHQEPAGTHAAEGVTAGATLGAVGGSLAAIAIGTVSGAVPLVIAGAAGLAAGSTMGGFVGAMLTRGNEKELSNFYEQALRDGQILVAVELHGPSSEARLARASEILAAAEAQPIALPEG